jgi:hypothetical protein
MNSEELKYHTALQPFFREKMGAWRVGDWLQDEELTGVVMAISDDTDLFVYFSDKCQRKLPHGLCFPLPLPIDRRNPERGLWGMVDWRKVVLISNNSGLVTIRNSRTGKDIVDTPELALLKALAAQEGVEI